MLAAVDRTRRWPVHRGILDWPDLAQVLREGGRGIAFNAVRWPTATTATTSTWALRPESFAGASICCTRPDWLGRTFRIGT